MILFIVNPISGQGNKTSVVSRLSKKDCKVVYTEYAGHAEILAREAEEDIVVAVGGDGTVNEVARGLIGKEVGDVVVIRTPGGDVEYEIDEVKYS